MVHTANGDVEEMDVLKRDTLGSAYRYQMNFNWKKDEAIYGLGSHIEDYMNLRGKKCILSAQPEGDGTGAQLYGWLWLAL